MAATRSPDEPAEAIAACTGLFQVLNTPVSGSWRDKLLPGGVWEQVNAPASSGYHITVALTELIETAAAS